MIKPLSLRVVFIRKLYQEVLDTLANASTPTNLDKYWI